MNEGEPIPETGRESSQSGELGQIVQELVPALGPVEGEVTALDGGITNRNFRARFAGTDYVIRIPGKDTNLLEIDRGAEVIANERAAGIGVAPPVAAALDEPQAIVTEFVEGEGMESGDLREPATLVEVARALRSIHDLGEPLPTTFDSFRIVETYAATARQRGATVPDAYERAAEQAARIEAALSGPEHDPVPCHNDLLAANFIRGPERIWVVDWEYAGMGDRYFDLANFAVNNELGEAGEVRAARGLLRRAARRAAGVDAEADEVHVGLPRGDVGRCPDGAVGARLRLRRVRREALRPDARDRRPPRFRDVARGGA